MSYVVGAPTKRHSCLNAKGCRVFADIQSKKTLLRRYHAQLGTKIPENAVTVQVWLSEGTELYLENAVTMQDWLPTRTELYPENAVTMQDWLSTRTELYPENAVAMQD